MKKAVQKTADLNKWIWHSYLKYALIPIIIIEFVFFCVNFTAHAFSMQYTKNYISTQLQEELNQISVREAMNIDRQLSGIAYVTQMYAIQTKETLLHESELSFEDASRLAYSPDGAYYTTKDSSSGGAALFYSGYVPVNKEKRDKAARLLAIQTLMKNIQQTYPLVSSVYFNTYDSLNIIYPYFNVLEQYGTKIDLSSFNFYYEADELHNPNRGVKWTDVYLDPAGHGWMVSSIAPVYNGDFLEGVVGIDITVNTMTQQILDYNVPWNGYAMLVSKDGTILALPKMGEQDWGLTELKDHHYANAILQDTFKPENYNLFNMEGLSGFADNVIKSNNGSTDLILNNQNNIVSWESIGETGWKVIFIVKKDNIYAGLRQIEESESKTGILIICSLLIFYVLFFFILYKRSRFMSRNISKPLLVINDMVRRIGEGDYYQDQLRFNVKEFQETSNHLIAMGVQLGNTNEALLNTQNELEKREAYLQAMLNSIDDFIFEVDKNGIIKNVRTSTPASCLQYNFSANELTPYSFLNAHDAKEMIEMIDAVVDSGEVKNAEYEVSTTIGLRWYQFRISLIANGSNNVAISVRDITQRKDMERSITDARNEAENASRAKSQFLSNMSHELRTPLNAVLGFAQVLQMDPEAPLNESQNECVYEIKKAGNHLLELIDEILDLARIESGRIKTAIEPVLISQIMEETLALVKPMAEKYGIQLTSQIKKCSSCFVMADRMRIKQVLINLISNAIKYNKPNGSVMFYCETIGNHTRFHVIDTGIGIHQAELELIFLPFHRLGNAKSGIEGTGIGLTMVKQLTELMNGRVFVESHVGLGSHFYIELPFDSTGSTLKADSAEQTDIILTPSENDNEHVILYIEDDPANLSLVEHILQHVQGIRVISASTAQVGIDLARAHKPKLILLDINLPDMDGNEMFKRLHSYEETASIPVIAISANAMEKDIQYTLNIGFCEYITKPLNVAVFLEKLIKHLKS